MAALVLKSRERPFAGAQVGLDEAQALTRVLKIDFVLERISVASAAELAGAVMQARDARGMHFFIVDAPAEAFKPLAEAVEAAIFSSSTPPRRTMRCVAIYAPRNSFTRCRASPCAWMRSCNIWCRASGPICSSSKGRCRPTPSMAKALENSAKKFGARIVAIREFKPGTDPRQREKNDPALLSAVSRDYDVVFVADSAFDFAARCPITPCGRGRWSAASTSSRWPGIGPGSTTARRR